MKPHWTPTLTVEECAIKIGQLLSRLEDVDPVYAAGLVRAVVDAARREAAGAKTTLGRECHHIRNNDGPLTPSGIVQVFNVNPRITSAPEQSEFAVCALCLGQALGFVLREIVEIPKPRA